MKINSNDFKDITGFLRDISKKASNKILDIYMNADMLFEPKVIRPNNLKPIIKVSDNVDIIPNINLQQVQHRQI